MSKSRLSELNLELDKVFQEIKEISKENRDLNILVGPSGDKWGESLGMNIDLFEEKLAFFRTRLNKFIDVYPSSRKKRVQRH